MLPEKLVKLLLQTEDYKSSCKSQLAARKLTTRYVLVQIWSRYTEGRTGRAPGEAGQTAAGSVIASAPCHRATRVHAPETCDQSPYTPFKGGFEHPVVVHVTTRSRPPAIARRTSREGAAYVKSHVRGVYTYEDTSPPPRHITPGGGASWSNCSRRADVQGYLAHKKTPTILGTP